MAQEQRKHDVFISYSSKDKKVADAIVADMEQHGIRCWYAPRDIRPGDEWAAAITAAIQQASIFVLVYTEDSNRSHQVTNEVTLAVNSAKTVIPFRLSASDMNGTLEYYLSSLHWLDAVDPPLNKNIELLRNKVLSILKVEEEAEKGAAAGGATASGAVAGAGTSGGDSGKKSNTGLLIGIVAAVIVACIAGFALFGGKGGKQEQATAQAVASGEQQSATVEEQKEAVAETPVAEEQKEAEKPAEEEKQETVAEAPAEEEQKEADVETPAEEEQKETVSEEPAQEEPAAEEPKEEPKEETPSEPAVDYVLPTAVPEEYYYHKGHTYAFYDASRYGFTTYDEVSEFCHEQGGHLAVINNRAENSFLYNLMKENYKITVFFGYTDKDDEGTWVWDGDESSYENWTRTGDWNLPDNGESWGGGEWKDGGEDYAEFNYDRDTNWGAPNDTTWNDASFMENTTIFFCEWEYDMRDAEE